MKLHSLVGRKKESAMFLNEIIKSHNKQNSNFDLFLELLYSTTLPGFYYNNYQR